MVETYFFCATLGNKMKMNIILRNLLINDFLFSFILHVFLLHLHDAVSNYRIDRLKHKAQSSISLVSFYCSSKIKKKCILDIAHYRIHPLKVSCIKHHSKIVYENMKMKKLSNYSLRSIFKKFRRLDGSWRSDLRGDWM